MKRAICACLVIFFIGIFIVSGCIDPAAVLTPENNNTEDKMAVGNVIREIERGFEDLNPPYEPHEKNVSETS